MTYYRSKFVTNSITTSFIAWGIVVPTDRLVGDKSDDFYDRLYDGNGLVSGSADGSDNYLVFIDESNEDLDDYYGTMPIDGFGGSVEPGWRQAIKEQCENLGLNTEGLTPGWFFTRYPS